MDIRRRELTPSGAPRRLRVKKEQRESLDWLFGGHWLLQWVSFSGVNAAKVKLHRRGMN